MAKQYRFIVYSSFLEISIALPQENIRHFQLTKHKLTEDPRILEHVMTCHRTYRKSNIVYFVL